MAQSIAIGTTSQLKCGAVTDVFPNLNVIPCKCSSGVAEQPVGKAETLLGATNRAKAAMALHPDADYWLGIENGIIHPIWTESASQCDSLPDSKESIIEGWTDLAAIVLIQADTQGLARDDLAQHETIQTRVVWSEELNVPSDAMSTIIKTGTNKPTGQMNWSSLKDPHAVITNEAKPRRIWLSEAMAKFDLKNI